MQRTHKKMALMALLNAPQDTWRFAQGRAYGDMDIDYLIQCAQIAERGKLHAVFLADLAALKDDRVGLHSLRKNGAANGFEPTTAMAALAVSTHHIGLVSTVSTTYSDPYTIARQIGSLDHISKGRAGWNVVTSGTDAEAFNHSLDAQLPKDVRYARAREHLEATVRLWDSWDDDAFTRDKASGLYFDPDKGHRTNYRGTYFKIRGPLNMPRPVQGRPIISQAGTSVTGYDMAAQWADVLYAKTPTFELGKAFREDIRARAQMQGRNPDEVFILPGLCAVVGTSVEDAKARFQHVTAALEPEEGLAYLSQWLGGYDLRNLALDEAIPDIAEINGPAIQNRIFLSYGARRLTLREAMHNVVTSLGHLMLFGTAQDIAREMARWVDNGAADGFALMPHYLPGGLESFVEHVVPELQKINAFHHDYAGRTLRENLGLTRPQSMFATA